MMDFHRLSLSFIVAMLLSAISTSTVSSQPRIDSLVPEQLRRNVSTTVVVEGEQLDDLLSIELTDPRIALTLLEIAPQRVSFRVLAGNRSIAGGRDLLFSFSDDYSINLNEALTVIPGPISLIAITPSTITRGQTLEARLQGLNLDSLVTIQSSDGLSFDHIVVFDDDPSQAALTLVADALASLGPRDITALSLTDEQATLPGAVYVEPGPLYVSTLEPSHLQRGQRAILRVRGENLDQVLQVQLGFGVLVELLELLDPTRLDVHLSVQQQALPINTPRRATFIARDEFFDLDEALTIKPGELAVQTLRPAEVTRGRSTTITVDGLNLDEVALFDAGAEIEVTRLEHISPLRFWVDLAVAGEASLGYRDVTVSGLFGQHTLLDGLRVLPSEVQPVRITYPQVVDFGIVDLRTRKQRSFNLYNQNTAPEVVVLRISGGDLDDFCFYLPSSPTIAPPNSLEVSLAGSSESSVGIEFRPNLPVDSSAILELVARGEVFGTIQLRGQGQPAVLSFHPPPPLTLPTTFEGEQAVLQVSTLSQTAEPVRIEDAHILVERQGQPHPEGEELLDLRLVSSSQPDGGVFFGDAMLQLTSDLSEGDYQIEILLTTDRASAQVVPLALYALVQPPISAEPIEETLDHGQAEAPDPASEPEPERMEDEPNELDLPEAEMAPERVEDYFGDGSPAAEELAGGCCSQVGSQTRGQTNGCLLLLLSALLSSYCCLRREDY